MKISLRYKEKIIVTGEVYNIVAIKERPFLSRLIKIPCKLGFHKYNLIHSFGFGWSYRCERCDHDISIEEYAE